MINAEILQGINKAFKTGELIKMLAEEEIKSTHIFNDEELKRAAMETNTHTITRKDVDFQKELLNDLEYQKLLCEVITMCDSLKYIQEEKREEYKSKVLEVVNKKDDVYNSLKKKFDIK